MDLEEIGLANPQVVAPIGVIVLVAQSTEAHSKIWTKALESWDDGGGC